MSKRAALQYLGYRPNVDFFVGEDAQGEVIQWVSASPQPSLVEIAVAEPAAEAALATARADQMAYESDRADLQTQYATGVARLAQIRDAASPTNAQVVQAVRDLAAYQLKILKYLRKL